VEEEGVGDCAPRAGHAGERDGGDGEDPSFHPAMLNKSSCGAYNTK
jgi:hypothetical protein